jgi:uncharacterized membrane protein (UPF0182 family)
LRVASNAESTEAISRRISLDNVGDGGSQVRFGDLQVIPVADGLIYVRPYYVSVPQSGSNTSVTEFREVIVSYNDQAVLQPTLARALAQLFPGFEGELNDRVARPTEPTPDDESSEPAPDDETDVDEPTDDTDTGTVFTAAELLDQADALFAEADEALAAGDLGTYQARIDEARQLIEEAVALLEGS